MRRKCAGTTTRNPSHFGLTGVLSGSPANRLITGWQSANIPAKGGNIQTCSPWEGRKQPYPLSGSNALRLQAPGTPGHIAQDNRLSGATLRSTISTGLSTTLTFAEERTSTGLI